MASGRQAVAAGRVIAALRVASRDLRLEPVSSERWARRSSAVGFDLVNRHGGGVGFDRQPPSRSSVGARRSGCRRSAAGGRYTPATRRTRGSHRGSPATVAEPAAESGRSDVREFPMPSLVGEFGEPMPRLTVHVMSIVKGAKWPETCRTYPIARLIFLFSHPLAGLQARG